MHRSSFLILVFLSFGFHSRALDSTAAAQTPPASAEMALFPNAKPLTMEGDIASKLVAGVDRFLLKKIAESETSRPRSWQYRFASVESFQESIEPKRKRLAAILGALDERVASPKLQRLFAVAEPAESEVTAYHIHAIRWPILADPDPSRSIVSVYGEGLLLEPVGGKTPVANVVAIPDCDQSPSQICGLKPGIAPEFQFARRLAERNCRVVVPMLISRKIQTRGGRAKLTNREYIYRSAYELGRHVIGYEVQSVRAVIDSFDPSLPVGVIGSGEGGRLALAAAAIDQRIGTVCLGGSFGASESVWQDPADRNVFGWLSEFGNAEMLTMVAPRSVVINHANVPSQSFDGVGGGAPGTIRPIPLAEGQREVERARSLIRPLMKQISWHLYETDYAAAPCNHSTIDQFLQLLTGKELPAKQLPANESAPLKVIQTVDDEDTQQRLVEQLDRHNQLLLRESPFVRRAFMSNLDASSLEAFTRTSDSYRQKFREETIGRFDEKLLPPSARIRKTWDNPNWTGFEVVLDVFPDVIAYGVLILPKDLKPGERRPVVVCQHGLEGRPTDTFLDDHRAYHDFAAKLAERGFITFAPQNLYLFKDRFRTLQRKANPLGKTLFSVIVPQHQQIVAGCNRFRSSTQTESVFTGSVTEENRQCESLHW